MFEIAHVFSNIDSHVQLFLCAVGLFGFGIHHTASIMHGGIRNKKAPLKIAGL